MDIYIEYLAVVLGIVYVLLAAHGWVWCWPAGILSSLLYIWINTEHQLYQDAILQSYYVIAGIYGWWHWQRQKDALNSITRLSLSQHLFWLITGAVLVPLFGYGFAQLGNALSYLDASVMVFSFIATWLTARKVLESWMYWIAIDLIAAVMYGLKGLQPTVFLYVIYALVAVYGFYSWRKIMVQHG